LSAGPFDPRFRPVMGPNAPAPGPLAFHPGSLRREPGRSVPPGRILRLVASRFAGCRAWHSGKPMSLPASAGPPLRTLEQEARLKGCAVEDKEQARVLIGALYVDVPRRVQCRPARQAGQSRRLWLHATA